MNHPLRGFCLRILYLILLGLSANWAQAQLLPGDKSYLTLQDTGYQYIYSEDHAPIMPGVVRWNRWFLEKYRASYAWEFDERASLILASGNNQIANGYATVIPQLKTVFYPSGILLQDEFAVSSWFKVLMIHESAHLYQLNVKSELSWYLKKVFGNALYVQTPLVVPIFIHPNVFLPTLLPEGNAVMNESRWGIGGRLFSGEIKALVYSQALAKKLDAKRLLNDHLDFPFGQEKYSQGGYFFQYLAEKYGVDQANLFFKNQAEHYIVPLILDDTFKQTYGSGYNQLIREYSRNLELKAEGQRQLDAQAFERTEFFSELNHDASEVFFLAQQKGKSYPYLWQIQRGVEGFTAEKRTIDLALGKVFKTTQGWASVSARRESSESMTYGLFLEGLKPYDRHWGWALTDERAGHSLAFEPTQSFFQGQLFKDQKFLTRADSTALLDQNGQAYYFVQDGDVRALYRESEKLFEYQGYYGKLMEIDPAGGVYFVASTEKGSGLFYWQNFEQGFQEVLASDRIISARKINDSEFIAVEVHADGYDYKVAASSFRSASPYFKENAVKQNIEFKNSSLGDIVQTLNNETKTYRYLTQLRYDSLDYFYQTDEDGFFMGGAYLYFSDPLEWNSLTLAYIRDSDFRDNALLSYSNTRHRLGFQLNYLYEEDVYYLISAGDRQKLKEPTNSVILNLTYPLFFQGRWSSKWLGQLRWDREDRPLRLKAEDHLAVKNELSLDWGITYPLAYQAFRAFNFTLSHQVETLRKPIKKNDDIYSVSTSGSYDVGSETYVNASYQAAFSQDRNISLDRSVLFSNISDDYYSRGIDGEHRMNQIQVWEAQIKKAINTSRYFARFPISLRRWAPFVSARHYETKESFSILKRSFWEYEAGAEIELLLIHKIPLRTTISGYQSEPAAFSSEASTGQGWSLRLSTLQDF